MEKNSLLVDGTFFKKVETRLQEVAPQFNWKIRDNIHARAIKISQQTFFVCFSRCL